MLIVLGIKEISMMNVLYINQNLDKIKSYVTYSGKDFMQKLKSSVY